MSVENAQSLPSYLAKGGTDGWTDGQTDTGCHMTSSLR